MQGAELLFLFQKLVHQRHHFSFERRGEGAELPNMQAMLWRCFSMALGMGRMCACYRSISSQLSVRKLLQRKLLSWLAPQISVGGWLGLQEQDGESYQEVLLAWGKLRNKSPSGSSFLSFQSVLLAAPEFVSPCSSSDLCTPPPLSVTLLPIPVFTFTNGIVQLVCMLPDLCFPRETHEHG